MNGAPAIGLDITLYDVTLRDGQHAVAHQLNEEQIFRYAAAADRAGVPVVEVGHGNGLGASSLQIGRALTTDRAMLETARRALTGAKLAAFLCPGLGTFGDVDLARECGVDVLRLGVHSTLVDFSESYVEKILQSGLDCHAVMLMSHMASADRLARSTALLAGYGCTAIGIMDSAGYLLPHEVGERIAAMARAAPNAAISFHAHNNLGLATANSMAAIEAGATIVDASARGFGAGAGNAQLEVVCAVAQRLGKRTGVDLNRYLTASELAAAELVESFPLIDSVSLVSGLAGVFSGFKRKVLKAADDYGVSPWDIFFELGRMQAIAGQEDLIPEAAGRVRKTAS
ncbi:4-hydroxy-2-oxovalerate aldolase [Actinosynnema sp. NPDC023587]|uniref:4-hydroxy-2-oxovalerate aldolase n=1 Tax=Actinosynnema sp. NPDC023587 TaxID=3154695 RepID=UPI0033D222DF